MFGDDPTGPDDLRKRRRVQLEQLTSRVKRDPNLTEDERSRLLEHYEGIRREINPAVDFVAQGGANFGGSLLRHTGGLLAGLVEAPLRMADIAVPGNAITNTLNQYGPAKGWNEIANLVTERLSPEGPRTGAGVAGGMAGEMAGAVPGLVGSGKLVMGGLEGLAGRGSQMAGRVGQWAERVQQPGAGLGQNVSRMLQRRALETGLATPFNAAMASTDENSAASNLAQFKDLRGEGTLNDLGRGVGRVADAMDDNWLERFAFETGLDLTAGMVAGNAMDVLGGGLRRARPEVPRPDAPAPGTPAAVRPPEFASGYVRDPNVRIESQGSLPNSGQTSAPIDAEWSFESTAGALPDPVSRVQEMIQARQRQIRSGEPLRLPSATSGVDDTARRRSLYGNQPGGQSRRALLEEVQLDPEQAVAGTGRRFGNSSPNDLTPQGRLAPVRGQAALPSGDPGALKRLQAGAYEMGDGGSQVGDVISQAPKQEAVGVDPDFDRQFSESLTLDRVRQMSDDELRSAYLNKQLSPETKNELTGLVSRAKRAQPDEPDAFIQGYNPDWEPLPPRDEMRRMLGISGDSAQAKGAATKKIKRLDYENAVYDAYKQATLTRDIKFKTFWGIADAAAAASDPKHVSGSLSESKARTLWDKVRKMDGPHEVPDRNALVESNRATREAVAEEARTNEAAMQARWESAVADLNALPAERRAEIIQAWNDKNGWGRNPNGFALIDSFEKAVWASPSGGSSLDQVRAMARSEAKDVLRALQSGKRLTDIDPESGVSYESRLLNVEDTFSESGFSDLDLGGNEYKELLSEIDRIDKGQRLPDGETGGQARDWVAEESEASRDPQFQLDLKSPETGAAIREVAESLGLGAIGAVAGATQGETDGERAWNALAGGLGMVGLGLLRRGNLGSRSGHAVPRVKSRRPVGFIDEARLNTGEVIATREWDGKKWLDWEARRKLTPEEIDANPGLAQPIKHLTALDGYKDPEAFGAAIIWRYGDKLTDERFREIMDKRFGAGGYDPKRARRDSEKFLAARMNEIFDPVNEGMPSFKRVVSLMRKGMESGGHEWYNEVRPAVVEIFGEENADLFIRAYAVTSAGADAYTSNINFAVKAMLSYKLGLPYQPTPKVKAENIQRAMEATGGIIGDRKVNSFAHALMGHLSAVVNDVWNHRGFGFGKIAWSKQKGQWTFNSSVTPSQYRFMDEGIRMAADLLGLEPSQAQGAFWVAVKNAWEGLRKEVYVSEDQPFHLRSRKEKATGKIDAAPLGDLVFKASPPSDVPPIAPHFLNVLKGDERLRKVISGLGSLEDAERVLERWGGSSTVGDDLMTSFKAKVASELQAAASRSGYAQREFLAEIVKAGAGATIGAAAAPDGYELAGAVGGAAFASGTAQRIIAEGFEKTGLNRAGAAHLTNSLATAAMATKGATEDDKRRAVGWYALAGAVGAHAMREAIPGVRAIEKAIGQDRVWDRMVMPSTDWMKNQVYDKGGSGVGNFFFPGHRLGEGYQELKSALRRDMAEAQEVSRSFFDRLKVLGTEGRKIGSEAIDEGIRGEDLVARFREAGIEKPEEAALAIEDAHGVFSTLGDLMVAQHLMSPETQKKWAGRYAPRLYMDPSEGSMAARGQGKTRLPGLDRLKRRGDAKPGTIDDAAIRVATGVLQESQMTATETFFRNVAADGRWVNREYYELSQQARLVAAARRQADPAAVKSLDAELAKIQMRRKQISAEMSKKAGWKQFDSGKGLGSLGGQWVSEDVFNDINGFSRMMTAHDWLLKGLRGYEKMLRGWKVMRTAYNPATHGRNIVASQLLSWLGDGPTPFGPTWMKAADQVKNKSGEMWDLAKEHGLTEGSNVTGDLQAARALYSRQTDLPENGPLGRVMDMDAKGAARRVHEKILDTYHNEDVTTRVAYFWDAVNRRGLDPKEAAKEAKQWVPAYENVSQFVRLVSMTGPSFFAFTSQALPMVAKAMATRPIRYAAMASALYGMTKILVDDPMPEEYLPDNMRGPLARSGAPDWAKKAAAFALPSYVPVGQEAGTGRESYLDFTYIMPWGDLAEGTGSSWVPSSLDPFSNPLVKIALEATRNRDDFTGRPILTPGMTGTEKVGTWAMRLAKTATPNLTPGIGYGWDKLYGALAGRPHPRTGDIRSIDSAVRDAILGLKERQVYPDRERRARIREMNADIGDARRLMSSTRRDRSITDEDFRQREVERRRSRIRALLNDKQNLLRVGR